MSVAGRAGHAFTPQAMLKGFECHARGVDLEGAQKDRVLAHVRAPKAYDVDLRVNNQRLVIQCTCPAEAMTPDPCRHAWAALLEVDRAGALEDLRGKRGLLKVETRHAAPEPAKSAAASAPAKKGVAPNAKAGPKANAAPTPAKAAAPTPAKAGAAAPPKAKAAAKGRKK